MVATVKAGKFAWVGGGHNVTDTAHVDNVVEGLVLAGEKGRPGEAYFVTDGEPVVFREFVTELLRTQGVEPPYCSLAELAAQ
jgi:nucleoside-diphosphate-sugar epimerase